MQKSTHLTHDIENEILDIMAFTVAKELCSVIRRASYYTIMADEITDASNREQVAVCFCWVRDDDFECHEDFVGIYMVDSIEVNALVAVLKDVILRMNLELNKCRGQCYDGASNMAGIRNGTAALLKYLKMSHMLFIHTVMAKHSIWQHVILCGVIRYYVTHLIQRQ